MTIKTSVEIIRDLDKVDKKRRYFHDTGIGVLCEVINNDGVITAIEDDYKMTNDISGTLRSITVDDGLTKLTLVCDPAEVDIDSVDVGDIVMVAVENKRYSSQSGYIVIVDGEVVGDGLGELIVI